MKVDVMYLDGEDSFDYSDVVKELWLDRVREAQDKFQIRFDLENNDPVKKQRKIKFKDGDVEVVFVCSMWVAGGDWQKSVGYFRCQLKDGNLKEFKRNDRFVVIPPEECGNGNLIRTESGWEPKDSNGKSDDKKDEKKMWEWLREHLLSMVEKSKKLKELENKVYHSKEDIGYEEAEEIARDIYLKTKRESKMQKLEFTAADLTKTEGKSFVQYLAHWMPVLNKLTSQELVGLFENAKDLVETRDMLLKISDPGVLVEKIKELKSEYKYPPNSELDKIIVKWEQKKIDDSEMKSKVYSEIKQDLGMGVSKAYLNKALWHINGGDDPEKSFADNKKKLMLYITNILLKGSGDGIVSKIEALEKVAVCLRNDEMLLRSIVLKEAARKTKTVKLSQSEMKKYVVKVLNLPADAAKDLSGYLESSYDDDGYQSKHLVIKGVVGKKDIPKEDFEDVKEYAKQALYSSSGPGEAYSDGYVELKAKGDIVEFVIHQNSGLDI